MSLDTFLDDKAAGFLGMRSLGDINFRDLIFEEVVAERNTNINIRTFKHSWFIAIAVLDYCENESIKKELANHVKTNWSKSDYEFFTDYIKNEKRFIKYFK